MLAFTNDSRVIAIGEEYLRIVCGFFILHGIMNIYNGALRGAGDTLFPMISSIICLWLIRIPLAYGLGSAYGRCGIWWVIGLSITIGTIATYLYYRSGYWKRKCIIKK